MFIDEFELIEHPRPDGSVYLTCTVLPGFHFILPAGEATDVALIPALREFARLYREAVDEAARREEAGTPMPVPLPIMRDNEVHQMGITISRSPPPKK
jgi:hypothetical protein